MFPPNLYNILFARKVRQPFSAKRSSLFIALLFEPILRYGLLSTISRHLTFHNGIFLE